MLYFPLAAGLFVVLDFGLQRSQQALPLRRRTCRLGRGIELGRMSRRVDLLQGADMLSTGGFG